MIFANNYQRHQICHTVAVVVVALLLLVPSPTMTIRWWRSDPDQNWQIHWVVVVVAAAAAAGDDCW